MLYEKNIKYHPENMMPCADNGSVDSDVPERIYREDLAATGGLFGYMDEHNIDTAPFEVNCDPAEEEIADNCCNNLTGGPLD